jgi:glycosyl transferase family 10 (putative fucosyltransferase)
MKVRIVKDWDEPDFFRQTPGGKGLWGGISFTDKNDFICDVLVVLNSSDKNLFTFCCKGGRWLMSQEPPHPFYLPQTKGYKYYDRLYTFWDKNKFPEYNIINTQTSLPWHIGKSYDELIDLASCEFLKKDQVSWVTSNLNKRPGHTLRLAFMDYLHQQNFLFHLYGRGFTPIEDKFEAIFPNKYSIAIENFNCNDYWTEKIADCFLSWTMPIYFGCANIKNYFPEQSMILIDPAYPDEALRIISNAMNNDAWKQNLEYIKEARELILNKYQFFPSVATKIKQSNLGRKRFYWIRKPEFK